MYPVSSPTSWYRISSVPASASRAYTENGRRKMFSLRPGTFMCTNCPGMMSRAICGDSSAST